MTTGMKQLMAQVAEFHRKCEHPVAAAPGLITEQRACLRMRLHEEDDAELDGAMWALNYAHEDSERQALCLVAKELVDSIVVRIGTALELGIPLDRVWAEVHASNMTKSADHARADGKILKGPDYRPPDIHRAIWGAGGDDDGE